MEKVKTSIKSEIDQLLLQLGIEADTQIVDQDGAYLIDITCASDPSLLIGKHAEGLLALQRIMQIIIFKKFPEKVEILVDINGYRLRQKDRLNQIAQNVAERVSKEGRSSVLRSFNSYERKVIHEYISSNFPDLQTQSDGEEPNRVLVISSKSGDNSMTALEEEFSIDENF